MIETVRFTQMKDGDAEDYALLARLEDAYAEETAARVLAHLEGLSESFSGYQITRLDHSLQSATMAERDGADVDWIVSALLHDIGDALAPHNHSQMAAAVVEPYVREQCAWVLKTHGVFQKIYYAHFYGEDPDARRIFREHPYYQDGVDFCERWDQAAFDPGYDQAPLAHFRPMVEEVFARKPYDPAVIRAGAREPLAVARDGRG